VKNKRSKNSIFYDSTKNKRRRQEQKHNLQAFDTKNFTNTKKTTNSIGEKRNFNYKNGKSSFRNHTSASPFFLGDIGGSPLTDGQPSRPDFTYKKGEAPTYLYEFTNSKFIYFLGNLDPKSYLVFVTLIALLIVEDLNDTEAKIIYAFISNIADTMQTLIEQEIILANYKRTKEFRELNNALHHDFETIYAELAKIKERLPQ